MKMTFNSIKKSTQDDSTQYVKLSIFLWLHLCLSITIFHVTVTENSKQRSEVMLHGTVVALNKYKNFFRPALCFYCCYRVVREMSVRTRMSLSMSARVNVKLSVVNIVLRRSSPRWNIDIFMDLVKVVAVILILSLLSQINKIVNQKTFRTASAHKYEQGWDVHNKILMWI